MNRRDPRRARVLGVWTACWLAAFLAVGVLLAGDLSLQWPVFAVPLLWALVALRPRRRPAWEEQPGEERGWDERGWDDEGWDDEGWDDGGWGHDEPGEWPADRWADDDFRSFPRAERTDTVERPAVQRPSQDDPWGRRRRR